MVKKNKTRGIKQLKGDVWLIDFQVDKKRRQLRIKASTLAEAKIKRQEAVVELRKQLPYSQTERERLNASRDEAWKALEGDILSDGVCKKNILRHRIVFRRFFEDFRCAKYPHIKCVSEISGTYIHDYKSYFVNELGHNPKGGWRAEIIVLKSMLRRLNRLGYCGKEVTEMLGEIKRPAGEKKAYSEIPKSKIRELLDFVKNDRLDYYGVLYFMARVGRRVEEATLIKRKDVVWDGLRPVGINIKAQTTKTKEFAPLDRTDNDLVKVIQGAYRLSLKHKTIYLFCSKRGRKLSQGTLQKYLRRVSEQIIGVGITPHYFRHRLLTECGKANVSMVDVMRIAGIRDTGVVSSYYQHTTADGQDKVLAVTRV